MNPPKHHFTGIFRRALGRGVWPALAFLVAGLIFTGFAVRVVKSGVDEEAKLKFGFICGEIQDRIEERLHDHEQILRSGAAFFADTDGVSREEWREFAVRQKISRTLPGIQGIGFALLVPAPQLTGHVSQIRSEGFPEYRVWPEEARESYTSIIFLEPFTGRNLRAFGYDMFSEPVRRAAMERARDEDEASLSGKVTLVQETGQEDQPGTLMYVPVYRMGAPLATRDERRAAILGWVYSPYRMKDLMEGILESMDMPGREQVRLSIFDGEAAAPAALLYDSGGNRTPPPDRSTLQVPVVSSGRHWLLGFTQVGGPGNAADYSKAWLVGGGGVLISVLLGGLALSLANTRFNARLIASRLTGDLRQSEERWKFALEGSGDGVWDWSVPCGEIFFSARWKAMLGYTESEVGSGLDEWSKRVHPEDLARAMADVQAHLDDQTVAYVNEHRVQCKDGSWKWILDRGMVVSRDAAGRPLRMIGTHKDITARKRDEAELVRLAQNQRALARLATEFINVPLERHVAAIDESLATMGQLIEADRAYLVAYDFAAGLMSTTHEWNGPGVASRIDQQQALPIARIQDWVDAHRRGEVLHFPSVAALPQDSASRQLLEQQGIHSLVTLPLMLEGSCLGFVGFNVVRQDRVWRDEDISLLRVLAELYANFEARRTAEREAYELQQDLLQARDAAQAASHAKGLFLANMSHEIRTPLNAILGYAQIMDRECCNCPTKQGLSAISRSGEHLLRLLTDLLEMVRSDVHAIALAPGDFDFYQILEDVRLMFVKQPEAKDLSLDLAHGQDVPQFIHADSGKVRQILVNLLGNAVKFTTRGGVHLSASVSSGGQPDGVLMIVDIEDTGCGIDGDELEHIFDVFGQAKHGRQSGKGTGLGLPLSRRYARALGGDVTVTSRPGEGSHFRFTFKARRVSRAGIEESRQGAVLRLAPAQRAHRLLVVDDEMESRSMLARMLTAVGFTVKTANSASAALRWLNQTQGMDLVLMDIRMPGMDGYEAIRRLRELPGGRQLPVMVVTASGQADEKELAMAAGADGYVSKPVHRELLMAEIARLTGVRYEYDLLMPVAPEPTPLAPGALAQLPTEQHRLLNQALRRGDICLLREQIERIAVEDVGLAASIRVLADVYDYDRLGCLLTPAKGDTA